MLCKYGENTSYRIRRLNTTTAINNIITALEQGATGGTDVGVVNTGVAVETGDGGVRDGVTVGINLFNS